MKPGYVIPVVFALLFGVTSLFEGGGQDGKIGEFRNAVVNRANQDQADAAAPAPEPKASIAAAKSSVWSKTEDYMKMIPTHCFGRSPVRTRPWAKMALAMFRRKGHRPS